MSFELPLKLSMLMQNRRIVKKIGSLFHKFGAQILKAQSSPSPMSDDLVFNI